MSDADPRRIEGISALSVLRRGMAASPELRVGLPQTVVMAMSVAGGKLLIPLLIQAVIDLSITTEGVRMGRVVVLCGGAMVLVVASIQLGRSPTSVSSGPPRTSCSAYGSARSSTCIG